MPTMIHAASSTIDERAHVVAFLLREAQRNWGIGSDEAARFTVMLDSLAKRIENGEHTLQRIEPQHEARVAETQPIAPPGALSDHPQRISARLLAHELRARAKQDVLNGASSTHVFDALMQAARILEEKEP